MLGRSALLAATNVVDYGNWLGNYNNVSLLLRNGTLGPLLAPFDESPNPINITTTGTTGISTTVFQYGDGSLFFPNNSSTATTAALSAFAFGSGDFTIEFWMRVSSPTWPFDYGLIFGIGSYGSGANIAFAFNGSNFGVMNQSRSGYSRSVSRGTDGVFHHVALARASSVTRFFYDGNLIGTTDLTTQSFGNSILYLNRVSQYSDAGIINGLHIDDLRITKGIARYTSTFTPPPAELPANITDDPDYNSVSLLLRNGTQPLVPLDESPTPKTITKVGDASVTTTVVKYGTSAMAFDENGGWLETNATTDFDFANNPFTIEAWINVSVLTSSAGVITVMNNLSSTGLDGYGLIVDSDGSLKFLDYVNASPAFILASAAGVITTGQWYHVAVCKEGTSANQVRLFRNGAIVASGTRNANIPVATTGQPARIGAWRFPTALRYFNGYIDDLRITKGIARYTSNFAPPPAELPNF